MTTTLAIASPPRTSTVAATYVPHAHQARMHGSHARFLSVVAGRRAGKTMGMGAEFVSRIYGTLAADIEQHRVLWSTTGRPPIFLRRPRRTYWVVAPSYKQVEEARRYVFDFLPALEWRKVSKGKRAGWNASERLLWLDPDILVSFRTAEDPLSLVSEGLDGLWLTEAARLKPAAWQIVRPGLSDRVGWALTDTTPLGQNWYWREFWNRGDTLSDTRADDYANFHWRTLDNPHIPPEEIERARREMPPKYFAREYEASFEAFIGLIYDMFREVVHIVTGPKPQASQFRRVTAGVDYGAASPGAIVVIGQRADDTRMAIHEEYAAGRLLPQWVETAKRLITSHGVRMFWCDPSAAGLLQMFRNGGIPCGAADNDVDLGIQTVATALHTDGGRPPLLMVHASCANLVREIKSYRWRQAKGAMDDPAQEYGVIEEPAAGQSDHAVDALRYVLVQETQPDKYRGAIRASI